jgi:hypothetical protein
MRPAFSRSAASNGLFNLSIADGMLSCGARRHAFPVYFVAVTSGNETAVSSFCVITGFKCSFSKDLW